MHYLILISLWGSAYWTIKNLKKSWSENNRVKLEKWEKIFIPAWSVFTGPVGWIISLLS